MFYSQFILAKKGPLGTIWIAAHLERKLRKNQVADTDIGVSVDSILFPDVPIALRLSSHLLLGVVRIYSKKVNYLFHDCSEALVKIKQAFRSTAVDLPPEESTAPYHSITLPETFDLENFELPDSAFLDSNFVDHHVSTREQITLQDTVNGTAFSTSKFGLDERFGDGDASQLGLELDEELFMDKNISQQHDEFSMDSKVSRVHHGQTSVPSSSMGIDVQFGYDEEKGPKVANELSELLSNNYDRNCFSSVEDLRRNVNSSHRHGYSIQTPDLNEVFLPDCDTALCPLTPHIPFTPEDAQTPCLMEPAQAPSTPGLLEEVIPSNFQEVPALSPQEKAGAYVESGRSGLCSSPYMEVECAETGNKSGLTSAALGHKSGETAEELPPFTSDLIGPMSESLPPTNSNVNLTKTDIVCLVSGAENQRSGLTGEAENTADHRHGNEEAMFSSGYSHETATMTFTPVPAANFEADPVTSNICTDNYSHGNEEAIFPSGYSHETVTMTSTPKPAASFQTDPVTSNICTDNYRHGNRHGNEEAIFPSGYSHETATMTSTPKPAASIETDPVTSNFCTNNYRRGNEEAIFPSGYSHETATMTPTPKPAASFQTDLVASNICTDNYRHGNEEAIFPSGYSHETATMTSTPKPAASFQTDPVTSNICTDNYRHGNEEAIFPSGYSHETATMTSTPKPAASFETDPVTSNICTNNLNLLGVISDVKGAPLKNNNEPSDIGNLGHVEVGGSCITINTSAVGADFVLRSCGSNLHPPSSHIVDGALRETSELFPRDHYFNFRTPVGENALHARESSFEVQGENSRYTNGRVINLDWQQTSECTPSVVKSVAAKPDELSTVVFSNVFPLDPVNYSSSSEFLGPDKMLSPACGVDLPNQGLQTTWKGVTESDGNVDRTSSHCSRKRRIMDSSAILQTGCSAKLSGIPRSRRISDYIPDDDDVLASILVGRKAPSLKMGSTPCLSKISSQKRPRTISRLGMSKRRKVLVDQTMVLQADAIRQQLINTEDIRRMRKKAPSTRPEIWRIYIGAMEDEIFYHSTLTGIPLQLNSLNDQYVLQRDPHVKTSGDAVSSRVSEFVNDTGDKVMDGSILSVPGIIVKMGGPSRISASDTMQRDPHAKTSGAVSSRVSEFVSDTGDKEMDGSILSVPSIIVNMGGSSRISASDTMQRDPHVKTSGEAMSSRVSEFVNDTGDKEMDGSILSVPGIIVKMGGPSRISASDTMQRDPHVKTSGEAVSSRVSEFVNDTGDKEMDGSILSVPGIIVKMGGPSRISAASDTMQRDPHVKTSGEAVSSSVSEFVNDTGDKEMDGSILSVPSITAKMGGPSRISASDTMQSHEGGAQCDAHDQLEEVPVRLQEGLLSNDHVSVISSMGDKEMNGSILSVPGIIVKMGGLSRISASDTMQSHEGGAQCDVLDQLEEVPVWPQEGLLSNDQVAVISSMEVDPVAGANSIYQETLVPEIDKSAPFLEKSDDKSINLAERSAYIEAQNPLNTPNDGSEFAEGATTVGINGDTSCHEKPDDKSINLAERSAYTEAQNSLNTPNDGSDFAECATTVGINDDAAFSNVISETFIQAENICIAVGSSINEEEKIRNAVETKNSESHYTGMASDVGTNEVVVTDESAFVVQGDDAPEQELGDEKRPITDIACGELPNIVSFESSIVHAPSTMGESSCIHEFNLEGGLDMDNVPVDIGVARDSSDFCSAINDNYTGFLNVDDEADLDGEANEAPNPQAAQSLENSGWSTRTRGVARYLKILFGEESGRGRKTIAVDRLLAGKTRKEASRMFFETLVLKTRDYIQVQQEKPFEYINIKPRSKLLASEF